MKKEKNDQITEKPKNRNYQGRKEMIYFENNFMSIIGNSTEYLLGIAETIIDGVADQKTIRKYYTLKQKVLNKGGYQPEMTQFTLQS